MLSPEQRLVDFRRTGLLTLTAAIVAVAVLLVLRLAGQDIIVNARGVEQNIPVGAVVAATIIGGIGAHLLARLSLHTTTPRRSFAWTSLAGLALSAWPPATSATTVSTAWWLMALHVVVAGVLVPPLAKALPARTAKVALA